MKTFMKAEENTTQTPFLINTNNRHMKKAANIHHDIMNKRKIQAKEFKDDIDFYQLEEEVVPKTTNTTQVQQNENSDYGEYSKNESKVSRRSRMKSLVQSQANIKEKEVVDIDENMKSYDNSLKQLNNKNDFNNTPYEEYESKHSKHSKSRRRDRKHKENGINRSISHREFETEKQDKNSSNFFTNDSLQGMLKNNTDDDFALK